MGVGYERGRVREGDCGALVTRHDEGSSQRLRQRGAEAREGGGQRVGQPRGLELGAELR